MTSEAPRFLAACWTSAGDSVPFRGSTTSPIDIRTRIEAASRCGYTGFGLTREDLVVARDSVGLETVAVMLADHGIETVQLEWITDWWTAGARRVASDAVRHDLLDAVQVLKVDNIKVGADDDGSPASYDQLCSGFDRLADDAAEVGARVGFENTPFGRVKTTEEAVRFVTDVAHSNGGLILDIWHAQRGGTPYDSLPALVPREFLVGVELDDGSAEPNGHGLPDTFDNRLLCGAGEFDVPSFISAVQQLGWDGPWGIEHMSQTSRQQPISEVLAAARSAALSCFS